MRTITNLALLLLFTVTASGQDPVDGDGGPDGVGPASVEWNARHARHLLNRAGLGATADRVDEFVELGLEGAIEALLAGRRARAPFVEPIGYEQSRRDLKEMGPEVLRAAKADLKARHHRQQEMYLEWWAEQLLVDRAPLRERMTLFWHGVLTTQATKVKDSYLLIQQNQLLRKHALGNYGELLRGILRDPAMLVYLDNAASDKDHPNENLARELLELFSLGEGNYSEQDVSEVARALTGNGYERGEGFAFSPRRHDEGRKTVLGIEGRHDANDVVDVLLAQPACGRFIAQRLITYLEGVAPAAERSARYGDFLRGRNYELRPFLRRLLADPEFYRAEVIAARIASPLDYLVGTCRRLELDPDPRMILIGAEVLGEQLFEPPSVKGWEGGESWITTSTLLARSNLVGALLGVVRPEDLASARSEDAWDDEVRMDGESMLEMARAPKRRDELARLLRIVDGAGYAPALNLSERVRRGKARTDREIVDLLCDGLLAIDAPVETRRMLVVVLRGAREELGAKEGRLHKAGPQAEHTLRRLAHVILSLPEAQLL